MAIGPTPGRLKRRSGVLLGVALLAVACDRVEPAETLRLDTTEVTLAPGVAVHAVWIGGAGAVDSIRPARVDATVDDVLRFVAADHRTHALMFRPESLSTGALEFLERTAQLRGPPLVSEGTSWVVSLEGAPPGRYPFFCRTHDAEAVIMVDSTRAR